MNDQTDQEAMADDWAAALAEQEKTDNPKAKPGPVPAPLNELEEEAGSRSMDGDANVEAILDIPVTLSVEIGRTRINIRNLLQLNQGSVVELDRLAGEPLDVLVNGTLIAHGEVVIVNERFGIRLTDVVSPADRVRKLR
jgi:flagellar motor switch protein FliN/FliY